MNSTPINRIETMIFDRYRQKMSHTMIRSIVSTPLYTGVISWEGHTYPGQHEAIVDKESFLRSQEILEWRAQIAATKPRPFTHK